MADKFRQGEQEENIGAEDIKAGRRNQEGATEEVPAGFQMRYSASERKMRSQEIERIRSQYVSERQDKKEEAAYKDEMEQLRRLDGKAKMPATVVSLSVGVGGTLVLGLGLSMCLAMDLMAAGIVVGVLGMAILSMAFPAHEYLLKKGKEKYGEQIQKLCRALEEEG